MSSSTAALSRTLRTITLTKINELEKQRTAYAKSKASILAAADEAPHQRERVLRLLEGVEDLDRASNRRTPTSSSNDLSNIRRWLFQSHYDSSIPSTTLDGFEIQLRAQLDVRTRRLDLGSLYSRLLTEWLDSSTSNEEQLLVEDTDSSNGFFEVVEQDRLKQLKERFESVVFNPLETNPNDIHDYLESLFVGDLGEKALKRLRQATSNKSAHILKTKTPFDERAIKWCLKGLLSNDLLRDDKKEILQEFLQDEVARKEICDVLNMKFADLDDWNWDSGPEGLPVEPRRQLNGKYRIMMDEDVLDAIFLHYIGMVWAVGMKNILCELGDTPGMWRHNVNIPQEVKDRRRYFLGDYRAGAEAGGSVEKSRQDMYRSDFFLSQLPSSVTEGAGGYDNDDAESINSEDLDRKSPKEIKQQLLRILATEVELQKSINGRVAVVQSDFQWFGTGLPHSSIFAVLKFVGVDEKWISFFRKFLEAPLNLGPVSDSAEQVRFRRRGVPMAHALEKFFGELVLFFMDLAVNREAGMLLYRFHDDLWLVGKPEECVTAWAGMKKFSAVMGLEFNVSKTGSVFLTKEDALHYEDSAIIAELPSGPVSIGFLHLDSQTGGWIIDQKQVDAHVRQLAKQLADAPSILAWVQTWNSCIGRFFGHTFGQPANCFGRAHVDAILETHKRIQDSIFPDSNACDFLKNLTKERFGVSDLPDAFVFLPESYGGLGVRNPFIGPFLLRDNVCESPSQLVEGFLEQEAEAYRASRRDFEELSAHGRKRRMRMIFTDGYGDIATSEVLEDPDTFMSMEEFTSIRESTSPELTRAWEELMEVPQKKEIVTSSVVSNATWGRKRVRQDRSRDDGDSEMRWIMQMYEKELIEKCGEMSIVPSNLLPLGILTILRKKKVAWQMVL